MPTKKVGRDARTGQFVPIETVKKRPSTTITQTVRTARRRKGK